MPESDERASIRTTGTSGASASASRTASSAWPPVSGKSFTPIDERHPAALEVVDRGE